jgi:hypothetical protein
MTIKKLIKRFRWIYKFSALLNVENWVLKFRLCISEWVYASPNLNGWTDFVFGFKSLSDILGLGEYEYSS